MSFKAYAQNIETKFGKKPNDYFTIATDKGYIKEGKIEASHAQLLKWLKEEMGLSHVYANFIISYLRLRTNDPKVSQKLKEWAYNSGYQGE